MPTRRSFLRLTGLAGLAAALARLWPAAAQACTPSGDVFPLTLPFLLGDDCTPPVYPTATPESVALLTHFPLVTR